MFAGLIASIALSLRQSYSAYAPRCRPVRAKTWSPFLNRVTSLPVDSISPANSWPRIFLLGALMPNPILRRSFHSKGSLRPRSSQSPIATDAAWTLTRTSLSFGVGFSTSLSSRTSGGPYFVQTIAFTSGPGQVCLRFAFPSSSLQSSHQPQQVHIRSRCRKTLTYLSRGYDNISGVGQCQTYFQKA